MDQLGALIGIGTDNGVPMNFHTDALWRLCKLYSDMGMPNERIIQSLTSVGAGILGKSDQLGSIQAGKLADIIVVEGNPLEEISAIGRVLVVMKNGVIYKQAARAITPSPRRPSPALESPPGQTPPDRRH